MEVTQQMGDDIVEVSGTNVSLKYFYDQVQTNQPLDLKHNTRPGQDFSIWSRGWTPTLVEHSDYLYGYVGEGELYVDGNNIQAAAGMAQVQSDISSGNFDFVKTTTSLLTGGHGDNPGDSQQIKEGIDAYRKGHPNESNNVITNTAIPASLLTVPIAGPLLFPFFIP